MKGREGVGGSRREVKGREGGSRREVKGREGRSRREVRVGRE